MEVSNNSLSDIDIFKKYAKYNRIIFYDIDNLIQRDNIEDFTCPICLYILRNPLNCSDNNTSHSFCKECIERYMHEKNSNNCPICKQNFQNKIKNDIIEKLNKFTFNCCFKNVGCKKIISYSDYFNHINNCEYNNIKYECQIKKYNYKSKKFIICGVKDNKTNIEKHLKLCALKKIKCIFCNENILQMDLEEHVQNKCKFGIINYSNGDKYIGEKKNKIKEGYGIYYCDNGQRYEGEWKNDKMDGYGIYYYNNGDRYEGERKNCAREGYGIYYYHNNGYRYEGNWKYKQFGYGVLYDKNNQIIYKGEFKNDKHNGYGIM